MASSKRSLCEDFIRGVVVKVDEELSAVPTRLNIVHVRFHCPKFHISFNIPLVEHGTQRGTDTIMYSTKLNMYHPKVIADFCF